MDDVKKLVCSKLEKMNISIDSINKNEMKYLLRIESIICFHNEKQLKALNDLKENIYSLRSISKESKISYQTFYNNLILKEYVETSINEMIDYNPYKIIDRLKMKIKELEDICRKMQYRDLKFELLKHEMEQLKDILKSKDREISQLREKNKDLINRYYK